MIIRLAALLLALATCTTQADEQTSGPEPLFEYNGKSYAAGDLSARMQQLYAAVLQNHNRAMHTLIDEMLFDVYVEQEAARQNRPVQEVGVELLAVPEPTDSEVRDFYKQIQTRINLPFEQVSARIRKELKRQQELQHRTQLIARLKSEGKFALRFAMPAVPVAVIDTDGRPTRGEPSAPVTVVEFSDYQCANCKRAVNIINDLLKKYPQDIKLVFMDFPADSSGISMQLAYGGVCAQNDGKFWAYHDAAFRSQATLSMDSPRELAKAVGIKMDTFKLCMQDRGTRAKVEASIKQARRLGVNATPTLFVDGRPFPSNDLIKDIGAYIDEQKAGRS